MGAGHDHSGEVRYEKPLWIALGLTTTFLIAEVVGGLLTNSLALLSDAAHMMTDVVALAISLVAVRLSRRAPDAKRTYGYARMEAIGATINGALLFGVAAYILWEAVERFRDPPEVAPIGMLVIAVAGLAINLVSMRLLKAGSGESLNIKGAYLEVWSDMLGSVGVLLAAIIIRFTGWTIVDPILAVLIGLWVLPRTWVLLKEAGQVLMEGVPHGVDLDAVRAALEGHAGVRGVHDLHVWSLRSNQPILTAHIVVADGAPAAPLHDTLNAMLHERFEIGHATLQVEPESAARHATDTHS